MGRRKKQLVAEVGDSGLNRWGNYVRDEWLPELRGDKGARIYREMADNEAVIWASLFAIQLLLRRASTRFSPADDSPEARGVCDFVETCIYDLDDGWTAFNSEFLSMLVFGWAAMEKVFKLRHGPDAPAKEMRSKHADGRFGWRKLALRAQESLYDWQFDDDGEMTAMRQLPPSDYKMRTIPREKMLLFRMYKNKSNPEGKSALRGAYTSYHFLKTFRFVEAVGIERYLAGLPVFEVPPDVANAAPGSAAATTKQNYIDMAERIRMDESAGLVIPCEEYEGEKTGYSFRLATGGGNKPADVDPVIRRYEQRMTLSFLSQFLLLGADKVGSFAQSSDQTDLFALGLSAILDVRDEEFNREAIPELVRLNGWPSELSPTMSHGDIESPDLTKLGAYIAQVVGSGAVVPDADMEDYLREAANLPPRPEGAPPVYGPPQIGGQPAEVPAMQLPLLSDGTPQLTLPGL